MELVIFIRLLWRHRRQLAVGVVVALGFAVVLGGSPVPPSGLASTRVMVDTPRSELLANAPSGMDTLSWRTTLLAMLLGTARPRDQLARAMHVPVSQIAVIDGELTSPVKPATLPVAAIQAASSTTEHYVLTVGTDDTLPIIGVQASAPNRAGAARLAQAAVQVLQAGVSPQTTARVQGLSVRQVDPILAEEKPGSAGRTTMALSGVVVFVLWCIGLAVWDHRRHQGRRRQLAGLVRTARA